MVTALALLALSQQPDSMPREADPQERHLTNIRQLTFGGQNAEAYWSADCKYLSYQARVPGSTDVDEQIYAMKADGSGKRRMSTGLGRCTCSYFTPDDHWLYFSSTHATAPGAQPPVDMSKGYVWMINPNYQMYRVPAHPEATMAGNPDHGQHEEMFIEPVFKRPGAYVAETTIAPNGKYMAWTSDFEGDLDIYRSDLNGGHVKKLTNQLGYDGGPFVSWDSKYIVYRRDDFHTPKEGEDYKELLKQHLIRPTRLEIWIMDADGSHKRQVTHLACASFAPFLAPDDKHIIFSSNYGDPKGREFDLFMINVDGTGLERITHSKDFDGFPMFTRDGKHLVWASDRFQTQPYETNLFVADWKP